MVHDIHAFTCESCAKKGGHPFKGVYQISQLDTPQHPLEAGIRMVLWQFSKKQTLEVQDQTKNGF